MLTNPVFNERWAVVVAAVAVPFEFPSVTVTTVDVLFPPVDGVVVLLPPVDGVDVVLPPFVGVVVVFPPVAGVVNVTCSVLATMFLIVSFEIVV